MDSPGDQSGDPEGNRSPNYNLDIEVRLAAFFDKGFPVVNLFLGLPFVGKVLYDHPDPIRMWSSIIYLACLILCFVIHLKMKNRRWSVQKVWWLGYVSTVLRVFSATALLLFMDTVNVVVVSPVLLLVLGLVAYWYWQIYTGVKPGMNWKDYQGELDFWLEMSVHFMPLAFDGLFGKVLFYTRQGSTNQLANGYNMAVAVAPECLLFYGVVLGLLAMLLCTMPPEVTIRRYRNRLARAGIPIMAYVAPWSVVLTSVMASMDILLRSVFFLNIGRSVLLVCFCIAVVAMRFYYYEDRAYRLPGSTTAPSGSRNTPVPGDMMTSLFTALMVSHSKYGIETSSSLAPLSWWFKGFVFSAVCCTLSYAMSIHITLLAEVRGGQMFPKLTKLSKSATIATIATMSLAIAFLVLVICLRGDEVKSIFF